MKYKGNKVRKECGTQSTEYSTNGYHQNNSKI